MNSVLPRNAAYNWQRRGQGFDPPWLHQNQQTYTILWVVFFALVEYNRGERTRVRPRAGNQRRESTASHSTSKVVIVERASTARSIKNGKFLYLFIWNDRFRNVITISRVSIGRKFRVEQKFSVGSSCEKVRASKHDQSKNLRCCRRDW